MALNFNDIDDISCVKRITLDCADNTICEGINAKQNDKGSRYLEIKIKYDGKTLHIPDDTQPRLRCAKPDGTAVYNDGCARNGKVYVELTEQVLAVPGRVYADVAVFDGQTVRSTPIFPIIVGEMPVDDAIVESSNEFSALLDALGKVRDGKSAYEVAQNNGYNGSETEWLASLVGDQGRGVAAITPDVASNTENADAYIVHYTDGTADRFFLERAEERDPTVPGWAKQPEMPALSELLSDEEHRTVSDAEIERWNSKSDFTGSYNDLTDQPAIPVVPAISTDISSDVESDTKTVSPKAVRVYINNLLGQNTVVTFHVLDEGEYDSETGMPLGSGATGVIYLVPNSGEEPNIFDEYIFANGSFEKIGTTEVNLSNYLRTEDVEEITSTQITELWDSII